MTAHRRKAAAAALTAAAALLTVPLGAAPAAAHGAPVSPVSRAAACAPQLGLYTGSAACRAATAQRGQAFNDWDNLRVAGVDGRDRQTIPDGKLCSGGKPEFATLDTPRTDWPSTRLEPGARITLTYSSTIPHEGTFRVYLTKPGYDPSKPLTWSDIPTQPFMTATDPQLTDGAYHISGRLPDNRTGRQILYTIWQNTSTSDTYYSCSDVVFPAKAEDDSGAATPAPSATAAPSRTSTPSTSAPAASRTPDGQGEAKTVAEPSADPAPQAESVSAERSGESDTEGIMYGVAAAVVLAAGALVGTIGLRRQDPKE